MAMHHSNFSSCVFLQREENGTYCIAHSTHIIQPLDISFFHPFKDIYRKKDVPKWKNKNNDRRMRKEDFPVALVIALNLFIEEKKVIMDLKLLDSTRLILMQLSTMF